MIVVEHRLGPWLEHVDRVVVLAPGGDVAFDGSVEAFRSGPTPAGIWMPGMPTPSLMLVPVEMAAPEMSAEIVTVCPNMTCPTSIVTSGCR